MAPNYPPLDLKKIAWNCGAKLGHSKKSIRPLGGESLDRLITPFIESVRDETVEIYNEFGLQHELGIYLRCGNEKSLIQFERNTKHFFPAVPADAFAKREIDVAIYSVEPRLLQWAIELKYPRNGQHPEQMFSFWKDVAFAARRSQTGC
jgi:hypothetical protein